MTLTLGFKEREIDRGIHRTSDWCLKERIAERTLTAMQRMAERTTTKLKHLHSDKKGSGLVVLRLNLLVLELEVS